MNNDDFASILHSRASGHEAYQRHVIITKSELHDAARMIQDTTIRLRRLCHCVLDTEEAASLHETAREFLEKT